MNAPSAKLSSEMFWRPDPEWEAARQLPEWGAFHQVCGRHGLCFDKPERDGKRGPYVTLAFRPVRQVNGTYRFEPLANGRAATVMQSLEAAFADCGVPIPEAAAMLARGLRGAPPTGGGDDFDDLLTDDFEELL